MKKITILITLLVISLSFGQNLISDPGFDTQSGNITGTTTPWTGYTAQVIASDDLTLSRVGNVNNGEGSIYQVIDVTPEKSYTATFKYRWVGGTGNYNIVPFIRENAANPGGTLSNFTCSTTPDVWHTDGLINFTVPVGITQVRIIFFKSNGNRPFRIDDVSITEDVPMSVADLAKFNFKSYPNPATDYINFSAEKNIDKIEIYSLLGQQVKNITLDSNDAKVNVSGLSKGVYIVKAFIDDAVGSYKFVKE